VIFWTHRAPNRDIRDPNTLSLDALPSRSTREKISVSLMMYGMMNYERAKIKTFFIFHSTSYYIAIFLYYG
jgi:hypothetical protein